ncbi:MAG: hypothetical protein LBN03_01630 [Bifidobacteriaceae bacterium]|nr:hypothetical protein [Bifidobacteriaceae bacterium]
MFYRVFGTALEKFSLAFCVAGLVLGFFIFILKMYRVMTYDEKSNPLGAIGWYALSIFATIGSYAIFREVMAIFNRIYGMFLSISTDIMGEGTIAKAVGHLVLKKIPEFAANDVELEIPGTIAAIIAGIIILVCQFKVLCEMTKLLAEIVERYIVGGVLYYLSPIAGGLLASSETASSYSKFLSMIVTEFLLLMLNVVFVSGFYWAMTSASFTEPGMTFTGGLMDYVFATLMILGWLKVGQHMDEYLKGLGMSTASTGKQQGAGAAILIAAQQIGNLARGINNAAGKASGATAGEKDGGDTANKGTTQPGGLSPAMRGVRSFVTSMLGGEKGFLGMMAGNLIDSLFGDPFKGKNPADVGSDGGKDFAKNMEQATEGKNTGNLDPSLFKEGSSYDKDSGLFTAKYDDGSALQLGSDKLNRSNMDAHIGKGVAGITSNDGTDGCLTTAGSEYADYCGMEAFDNRFDNNGDSSNESGTNNTSDDSVYSDGFGADYFGSPNSDQDNTTSGNTYDSTAGNQTNNNYQNSNASSNSSPNVLNNASNHNSQSQGQKSGNGNAKTSGQKINSQNNQNNRYSQSQNVANKPNIQKALENHSHPILGSGTTIHSPSLASSGSDYPASGAYIATTPNGDRYQISSGKFLNTSAYAPQTFETGDSKIDKASGLQIVSLNGMDANKNVNANNFASTFGNGYGNISNAELSKNANNVPYAQFSTADGNNGITINTADLKSSVLRDNASAYSDSIKNGSIREGADAAGNGILHVSQSSPMYDNIKNNLIGANNQNTVVGVDRTAGVEPISVKHTARDMHRNMKKS